MVVFIPQPALAWIAHKLPWLFGADLLLTLLAQVSVSEVADRLTLAIGWVTTISSVMLLAAMVVLTSVSSPAAKESVNPPSD